MTNISLEIRVPCSVRTLRKTMRILHVVVSLSVGTVSVEDEERVEGPYRGDDEMTNECTSQWRLILGRPTMMDCRIRAHNVMSIDPVVEYLCARNIIPSQSLQNEGQSMVRSKTMDSIYCALSHLCSKCSLHFYNVAVRIESTLFLVGT
jgi:hypothetical protein